MIILAAAVAIAFASTRPGVAFPAMRCTQQRQPVGPDQPCSMAWWEGDARGVWHQDPEMMCSATAGAPCKVFKFPEVLPEDQASDRLPLGSAARSVPA